jgi:hypothetical protein
MEANEPRRFFVVHLQKSAGTTLRDRFRATFPSEAIYPNRSDGGVGHAVISLSNLLERWTARRAELRLIAGHFPLSTVELLDADFVTVSILRPPVERTLSYLRHQKMLNARDKVKSLEEIYDDPFRFNGLIRNHMTRMFSIGAEEMAAGDGVLTDVPDTSARLDRAKQGIAGLDGFGLQPCFEEFWEDFATRFGLEVGEPVRSNRTQPDDGVTDALVARITADNGADLELYDYAERLYHERRAAR